MRQKQWELIWNVVLVLLVVAATVVTVGIVVIYVLLTR